MFRNVIYKPSFKCNLNCSYCYKSINRESGLDEKDWKPFETLERLIDMLNTYKKNFRFCLHGGEVMVFGYKKMAKMFEIIKKSPYVMNVTIQSNMVGCTDNVISVLKDYDVSVGASYDGPRSLRLTKNGRDSSPIVRKNIIRAKNAGINVGILGQLLPMNTVEELTNDIMDIGVQHFEFRPPFSFDCDEEYYKKVGHDNRMSFYMEWLNRSIPKLAERGFIDRSVRSMTSSIFPDLAKNKIVLCNHGPCVFSWHLITVDGDGVVAPCNIIGRKNSLGNIWNNTFEELMMSDRISYLEKRYEALINNHCKNCFALSGCYGGCFGDLQYQMKREYLEYNYLAVVEDSVPTKCDEIRALYLYVINMSVNNKKTFNIYLESE